MLFDEDEIKSRWEEYVSELYNDDRGDPPEIEDDDGEEVLISEIEKAIKDLKLGKASGSDMITSEIIKALDGVYGVCNTPTNMEAHFYRFTLPSCRKITKNIARLV